MIYCGQCGGRVYEEDRFCGNCGAGVSQGVKQNVFNDSNTNRRIEDSQRSMPGASTTPRSPDHSIGRGTVLLLSSVAVLVILLGAGAFTLMRLDPLGSMAGEVVSPNEEAQAGAPEGAVPPSTVEEESYPEPTQTDAEPTYGDTGASSPEETIEDEQDSVASSDGFGTEEEAVEEVIYDHYNAIGDNDFAEAYSYFSSDFQSGVPQQGWIDEQETFEVTDSTVFSTEVEEVGGSSATASVEVGFEDNTGSPAFAITWELLKEDGEWRLDEQADAEKIR